MTQKEVLKKMKNKIEDIRKLSLELAELRHISVREPSANKIQTVRAALGLNISELIKDYDEWFKSSCIGCEY